MKEYRRILKLVKQVEGMEEVNIYLDEYLDRIKKDFLFRCWQTTIPAQTFMILQFMQSLPLHKRILWYTIKSANI